MVASFSPFLHTAWRRFALAEFAEKSATSLVSYVLINYESSMAHELMKEVFRLAIWMNDQ